MTRTKRALVDEARLLGDADSDGDDEDDEEAENHE